MVKLRHPYSEYNVIILFGYFNRRYGNNINNNKSNVTLR